MYDNANNSSDQSEGIVTNFVIYFVVETSVCLLYHQRFVSLSPRALHRSILLSIFNYANNTSRLVIRSIYNTFCNDLQRGNRRMLIC